MGTQAEILTDKTMTLVSLVESLRGTVEAGGVDQTLQSLDRVQILRMIEETAASATRTAVQQTRERRATWGEIARMLGISAQAAQQRYGHR